MSSDDRERHFNLHTTPEVMAGVYANFATVSHQAMRELIDAMEDNWSKWQTREGIKRLPEIRDRPDYQ